MFPVSVACCAHVCLGQAGASARSRSWCGVKLLIEVRYLYNEASLPGSKQAMSPRMTELVVSVCPCSSGAKMSDRRTIASLQKGTLVEAASNVGDECGAHESRHMHMTWSYNS